MTNPSEAVLKEISEKGYRPCYGKAVKEGDVICFLEGYGRDVFPVYVTVNALTVHKFTGGERYLFIGVKGDGSQIHCELYDTSSCWIKVKISGGWFNLRTHYVTTSAVTNAEENVENDGFEEFRKDFIGTGGKYSSLDRLRAVFNQCKKHAVKAERKKIAVKLEDEGYRTASMLIETGRV